MDARRYKVAYLSVTGEDEAFAEQLGKKYDLLAYDSSLHLYEDIKSKQEFDAVIIRGELKSNHGEILLDHIRELHADMHLPVVMCMHFISGNIRKNAHSLGYDDIFDDESKAEDVILR